MLIFDLRVMENAWASLAALERGEMIYPGIQVGACPYTDLSYVGAGWSGSDWTGGIPFGPVDYINQGKVDLAGICFRQLQVYCDHDPAGLTANVSSCLRAFCQSLMQRTVQYMPLLAAWPANQTNRSWLPHASSSGHCTQLNLLLLDNC